jgi:hypothetical protein
MLEIGKTYLFKTIAHYYLGRVTAVTPTHATLEDASEVYETGPLSEFFAGKVKTAERVPDGSMVMLNCPLIAPWPHKLPMKAVGV